MSESKDGGPAFPHTVEYKGTDCAGVVPHGGASLRDYFAAKAIQGIIASFPTSLPPPVTASEAAYQYADAMLKAREA